MLQFASAIGAAAAGGARLCWDVGVPLTGSPPRARGQRARPGHVPSAAGAASQSRSQGCGRAPIHPMAESPMDVGDPMSVTNPMAVEDPMSVRDPMGVEVPMGVIDPTVVGVLMGGCWGPSQRLCPLGQLWVQSCRPVSPRRSFPSRTKAVGLRWALSGLHCITQSSRRNHLYFTLH